MERHARALAKERGLDPDETSHIYDSYDGAEVWDVDGEEWMLFDDYDDAVRAAEEYVSDFYDESPESFASMAHYYVRLSPMDVRIIAGEEADFYTSDRDDDDLIEQAGLQDQYEEAVGEYEELAKSGSTDARLKHNITGILDAAREQVHDNYYQETKSALENDPIGWWQDRGGEGIPAWMSVDVDSLARDVVINDGIGHTLGSYDGACVDLSTGGIAMRLN